MYNRFGLMARLVSLQVGVGLRYRQLQPVQKSTSKRRALNQPRVRVAGILTSLLTPEQRQHVELIDAPRPRFITFCTAPRRPLIG